MTRISTLTIAAIAAVALPAAVSAAPKATSADTATSEQQTTAAKPQRYCVVDTLTGSRLQTRECKTLDAWLDQGFDPRAKK